MKETMGFDGRQTMSEWQSDEERNNQRAREAVAKMVDEAITESDEYVKQIRSESRPEPKKLEEAGFGQTPIKFGKISQEDLAEMRRIREQFKAGKSVE